VARQEGVLELGDDGVSNPSTPATIGSPAATLAAALRRNSRPRGSTPNPILECASVLGRSLGDGGMGRRVVCTWGRGAAID